MIRLINDTFTQVNAKCDHGGEGDDVTTKLDDEQRSLESVLLPQITNSVGLN